MSTAAAAAAAGKLPTAVMEAAEGYGYVNWWGFSPALDLLGDLQPPRPPASPLSEEDPGGTGGPAAPLNVLVAGAGDLRHVLLTVSRLGRKAEWGQRPVHFFVAESCVEQLARHLLLLAIAVEGEEVLPFQAKVETFLEVLGNALVRATTSDYVSAKAKALINLITDYDQLAEALPMVSLKTLKYRERDELEAVFKFWANQDRSTFDMPALWEARLRTYYKQRYDARTNLVDWDYSMRLSDITPIVHAKEYGKWRATGVAFEMRDAQYDSPNRTLASGRLLLGAKGRVAKRGYWGDIVNSPYVALGTEADNPELFKRQNDKFLKGSTDVAQWSASALLHGFNTGERYSAEEDKGTGISEVAQATAAPHSRVQIHLLPVGVADVLKKAKYVDKFDVVYFANSMSHHVTAATAKSFRPHARLILETAKHMVTLKPEQAQAYVAKARELVEPLGFTPVGETLDGQAQAHVVFQRR